MKAGLWVGKSCPNYLCSPESAVSAHGQWWRAISFAGVSWQYQADIKSLKYSMNKYLQYLLTAGSSGNSLKFLTCCGANLCFCVGCST